MQGNYRYCKERHGGLMASALDSESSSPGSSPGWGHLLHSWARHFTLTHSASLHPGVNGVQTNLMLGDKTVME